MKDDTTEKKGLVAEYQKTISQLEKLSTAMHAKGVSVTKEGTIDIVMTPNELSTIVDVKRKIFQMKQDLLEYEQMLKDAVENGSEEEVSFIESYEEKI